MTQDDLSQHLATFEAAVVELAAAANAPFRFVMMGGETEERSALLGSSDVVVVDVRRHREGWALWCHRDDADAPVLLRDASADLKRALLSRAEVFFLRYRRHVDWLQATRRAADEDIPGEVESAVRGLREAHAALLRGERVQA